MRLFCMALRASAVRARRAIPMRTRRLVAVPPPRSLVEQVLLLRAQLLQGSLRGSFTQRRAPTTTHVVRTPQQPAVAPGQHMSTTPSPRARSLSLPQPPADYRRHTPSSRRDCLRVPPCTGAPLLPHSSCGRLSLPPPLVFGRLASDSSTIKTLCCPCPSFAMCSALTLVFLLGSASAGTGDDRNGTKLSTPKSVGGVDPRIVGGAPP